MALLEVVSSVIINIAIRKTFLIRIFDAPKVSGTGHNPYNKTYTRK